MQQLFGTKIQQMEKVERTTDSWTWIRWHNTSSAGDMLDEMQWPTLGARRDQSWLLLWIILVISVLFCYAFMHVCLLMPCGHLMGKGWPLGYRLWCLIVTLSLSLWYPGLGVVLDCIDSWYLPSFLLLFHKVHCRTLYIDKYKCLSLSHNSQ